MSHLYRSRVKVKEGNAKLLDSLGLTPREAEVLMWITQGKTNYEIGLILGARTGTICKHVEHILAKLHAENRTTAALIAFASLHHVTDFLSLA
jgi:DNA-binding CsgD family transcriptional regulator